MLKSAFDLASFCGSNMVNFNDNLSYAKALSISALKEDISIGEKIISNSSHLKGTGLQRFGDGGKKVV